MRLPPLDFQTPSWYIGDSVWNMPDFFRTCPILKFIPTFGDLF